MRSNFADKFVIDTLTRTHTHRQQYPEAKNWARAKTFDRIYELFSISRSFLYTMNFSLIKQIYYQLTEPRHKVKRLKCKCIFIITMCPAAEWSIHDYQMSYSMLQSSFRRAKASFMYILSKSGYLPDYISTYVAASNVNGHLSIWSNHWIHIRCCLDGDTKSEVL